MPDNSLTQGNATPTGQARGNPWHDPKNGQFTSGPASATAAQGNAPADSSDEIVVTASKAARDAAQVANYTQERRPGRANHIEPRNLLAAMEKTGKLSASDALAHAEHAAQFRDILISKYKLPVSLATALAANAELESSLNDAVTQKGKHGIGQGLFQLTDPARKEAFNAFTQGTPIEKSTTDQQVNYQIFELKNTEQRKYALALQVGTSPASLAAGYAYFVERPHNNLQNAADRYAVGAALNNILIK